MHERRESCFTVSSAAQTNNAAFLLGHNLFWVAMSTCRREASVREMQHQLHEIRCLLKSSILIPAITACFNSSNAARRRRCSFCFGGTCGTSWRDLLMTRTDGHPNGNCENGNSSANSHRLRACRQFCDSLYVWQFCDSLRLTQVINRESLSSLGNNVRKTRPMLPFRNQTTFYIFSPGKFQWESGKRTTSSLSPCLFILRQLLYGQRPGNSMTACDVWFWHKKLNRHWMHAGPRGSGSIEPCFVESSALRYFSCSLFSFTRQKFQFCCLDHLET